MVLSPISSQHQMGFSPPHVFFVPGFPCCWLRVGGLIGRNHSVLKKTFPLHLTEIPGNGRFYFPLLFFFSTTKNSFPNHNPFTTITSLFPMGLDIRSKSRRYTFVAFFCLFFSIRIH